MLHVRAHGGEKQQTLRHERPPPEAWRTHRAAAQGDTYRAAQGEHALLPGTGAKYPWSQAVQTSARVLLKAPAGHRAQLGERPPLNLPGNGAPGAALVDGDWFQG